MAKRVVVCCVFAVILLSAPANAHLGLSSYRPGAVLVRFQPDVSPYRIAALFSAQGWRAERVMEPIGVYSLRVPAGREMAAIEALRGTPEVVYAELDYQAQAAEAVFPNDPDWAEQWSLRKMGVTSAWEVVTGTPDIVIAVLDTGVHLAHEDLNGQIWTNPDEIPGNRLDDDGNGKIDDVYGWHFFHRWTGSGFIPDEDADVWDDNGHGTHVSGIAAAATNNGIGVAGIAWQARLMPVKVLDMYGTGWYSDIAAGIIYAVDNGARIVNLSLGGEGASATLCAAVEYAYNRNALVVAAAGNTGGAVVYPAACAHALAVAATDEADARASFSNHGPELDVAAPGVDIYSTWCRQDVYLGTCMGSYYFTKSGTSMATPHVSGLAALVWSHWPEWTNEQVARHIQQTAVDLGELGWDEWYGWGRVDALIALALLQRSYLPLVTRNYGP
jgi:subtilisin family serine protease